jgi:hypothetical protein
MQAHKQDYIIAKHMDSPKTKHIKFKGIFAMNLSAMKICGVYSA